MQQAKDAVVKQEQQIQQSKPRWQVLQKQDARMAKLRKWMCELQDSYSVFLGKAAIRPYIAACRRQVLNNSNACGYATRPVRPDRLQKEATGPCTLDDPQAWIIRIKPQHSDPL